MRTVPAKVRREAALGLTLRKQFGRGGTIIGMTRARQLAQGRTVSDKTIMRMVSYFARHEVDKNAANYGNKEKPSNGYIAWLLWGGDSGRAWALREKAKIIKTATAAKE